MKKHLLGFTLALALLITIPGCYTVIWSPDMNFPTKDNSENTDYGYYQTPYYYYYDYPWWYSLPSDFYQPYVEKNRNETTSGMRNNNGERNGSGNGNLPINYGTPTRSSSTTTGNTSNPPANNSGSSRTNTTTKSSNDSRSSSNNSTHEKARNNDGGRNSNGGH